MILAVTIISCASIVTNLVVYGHSGLNGALQLLPWLRSSVLPITVGQAALMLFVLLLAYGFLCGAIMAMLSALSGSGVVSLAVSIGITLLTMHQYDVPWVEYMPSNFVDQHIFMSFSLTNIFTMRLTLFQSGLLLCIWYWLSYYLFFAGCAGCGML